MFFILSLGMNFHFDLSDVRDSFLLGALKFMFEGFLNMIRSFENDFFQNLFSV